MGRVYKALVRAERWKDRSRPIGRPESLPDQRAFAKPEQMNNQASVARPVSTRLEADLQQGAPLNFDDSTATASSFGGTAMASAALAQEVRLDAISVEELFPLPEPVTTLQPFAPPSRLYPAPRTAPVFVEPQNSAQIFNLKVDAHLSAITNSDELAAERYRTLAVRILNLGARRKLKTLLVTSALEGEGKSTVAVNLAWVMSKAGERRVLLIDADLRNPSVSRLLGLKSEGGLIEVAEGRASLIDAAIRIDPNGLYVLASQPAKAAAGQPAAEKSDALTSSRVEALIQELEQYFDFIIIDAPPIADFADAQRLASILDGTVMVARAGRTPHAAVTDALKLVPKERRVGVVLNESQIDEEIAYNKDARRNKQSRFARLFGAKRSPKAKNLAEELWSS